MSKPDAKPQTTTAAKAAPATPPAESPATGGDAVAAVVHSTPTAPHAGTVPDTFHGHGGLYTTAAGQRTLTERTLAQHEATKESP